MISSRKSWKDSRYGEFSSDSFLKIKSSDRASTSLVPNRGSAAGKNVSVQFPLMQPPASPEVSAVVMPVMSPLPPPPPTSADTSTEKLVPGEATVKSIFSLVLLKAPAVATPSAIPPPPPGMPIVTNPLTWLTVVVTPAPVKSSTVGVGDHERSLRHKIRGPMMLTTAPSVPATIRAPGCP